LNRRLANREFVAGAYSIADIACYPWIVPHAAHGQSLDEFPDLKRWFEAIAGRPATIAAYRGVKDVYSRATPVSDEERKTLFGRTAASLP
jgi:GST-like protein